MRARCGKWILIGITLAALLLPCLYLLAFVPRLSSPAVYAALIPSARQLRLLARTFALGAGTTVLSFAFALAPALLSARTRSRLKGAVLLLSVATLLIPPYILCYCWTVATGPHGFLGALASRLFGTIGLPLLGLGASVFVLALWLWPVWTLMLAAALRSMDPALEEAGLLNASARTVLLKVTAPAVASHAIAAALVVFVLASSNYSVPHLLSTPVYASELLSEFQASHDFARVSAVAFSYVVLILLLLSYVWSYEEKAFARLVYANPYDHPSPIRFRSTVLAPLACAVILASFGVPLVEMLRGLFAGTQSLAALFAPLAREIGATLFISALAATVIAGLALPLALFASQGGPARWLIGVPSLATFAVPGVLIGVGLIRVYNQPGPLGWVYGSFAIIIIGLLVRFLFVAWRVQLASFERIDPDLIDAAKVMGAGSWQLLWHVYVPMGGLAVAGSWVLAFVLASGELAVTMNVSPPGWSLLATSLLNLMHYGRDEVALSACLILVSLSLAAALLFLVALHRGRRKRFL